MSMSLLELKQRRLEAEALASEGRCGLEEALEALQTVEGVAAHLYSSRASSGSYRQEWIWCRISFANVLLVSEQYPRARAYIVETQEACAPWLDAAETDHAVTAFGCEDSLCRIAWWGNRAIAEFHTDKDTVEEWDKQGLELAKKAIDLFGESIEWNYFYALFLSFLASDQQSVPMFDDAITIFRTVVDALPPNAPMLSRIVKRLASTLRLASYACRHAGQPDKARQRITEAVQVATDLQTKCPRHVFVLRELSVCHSARLSHLRGYDTTTPADLIRCFQDQKETRQTIQSIWPTFWSNVACLADVCLDMYAEETEVDPNSDQVAGHLKMALRVSAAAVDHADPSFSQLEVRAQCLAAQAKAERKAKNYDKALSLYADFRECFHSPRVIEADEVKRTSFFADTYQRGMEGAAWCALKTGNPSLVLNYLQDGDSVAERFLPGRAFQVQRSSTWSRVGRQLLEDGHTEEATVALRLAADLSDPLFTAYPWHTYNTVSYGSAHLDLARIFRQSGDADAELPHLRAFAEYCEVIQGEDQSDLRRQTRFVRQAHLSKVRGRMLPDQILRLKMVAKNELDQLRALAADPPKIKLYSIPCFIKRSNLQSRFCFYFSKAVPDKHPLEDQIRMLEEDFTAVVPEVIKDSIENLQALALKNNVSFLDLLDYALK
jgi:tetratricopeptide (TPR) repeat protein